MKPHNYFWSILFIITIWLFKIYIISLFNYSIGSIATTESIYFILSLIPISIICNNDNNKKYTSSEESLGFILISTSLILLFVFIFSYLIKLSKRIFKTLTIKINNPITKFNNWIDKKFTKNDKQND